MLQQLHPTPARSDARPESIIEGTVRAFSEKGDWKLLLDQTSVPAYATDASGRVTFWNQACVDFAGRQPQLGEDRWCVTWKLFTLAGDPLPHDECPMADAIKTGRRVWTEIAIAKRPDGTRRAFRPYATPLFDEEGSLVGGVNLLIDVSQEQAVALAEQASRCRRLLQATTDPQATQVLKSMARGYAAAAAELRGDDDL